MVNPNEAPKGYMAVDVAYTGGEYSCDECSFSSYECGCVVAGVSCLSHKRDDNCGVYFIPKNEQEEMSHTEDTQHVPSVIPGISLRDYFAGCALSGYLADTYLASKSVWLAYQVADAMLEEREKASNGGDNVATN